MWLGVFFGRKHWLTFRNHEIEYEWMLLKLWDGGQITLQIVDQWQSKMLIIIPGLTGHGDELYCKNSAQKALDNGYDVCVLNHWGGSKTEVTSPKLYCAGSSWDLKEGLEYLS